jgi:putative DNA primase/helicase
VINLPAIASHRWGELQDQSRNLVLISADEFASQPCPPQWIIRDLFEEGAFGMIHGPSGSGKSFVAIDIAMHIACAKPGWHGSAVRKPGTVVYLAGEGHYGMRRRVAAWFKHYGRPDEETELYVSKSACDLDQAEGFMRVFNSIRSLPKHPTLIVVDTLHRFLSGDENSAQDARKMITACDRLREEFGCALILVHHTGVNGEAQHRARGSSAWRGAVDFEYSIDSKKQVVTLTNRKAKDGPEIAPRHFALHEIVLDDWLDEEGEPINGVIILPTELKKVERPDAKVRKFLNWFEEAWLGSTMEAFDGEPFLPREAMLNYLKTQHNMTKRTAENHLAPSREGHFIQSLKSAGRLKMSDKGWVLTDPTLASALMLSKPPHPQPPLGTLGTPQEG